MVLSTSLLKKIAAVGGIVAISCGSFFTWRIQANFREQPFYQQSLELLNGYPPALNLLGPPIRTRRVDLSNSAVTFCDGLNARINIPLVGKKQSGTLHTWASRSTPHDSWIIDRLDLEVVDRKWTFYVDPNSSRSNSDTALHGSDDLGQDLPSTPAESSTDSSSDDFFYTKLKNLKTVNSSTS